MGIWKTIFCTCALIIGFSACNSNRTNTEADREATYTQDGKEINPTEGEGEGTAGKKYMETTDGDSARVEQ
ncbi:hypothetical protein [Marinoscillum furvescens]|uniref:Uncharacterized protein n=1 Tax=Marinoscillum furvescens DSM 4134 TaxID=1122208 RepID=A0A3D9KYG7_MARFU|nr:hypothetical protein [Marinoscillum furvescens]RED92656.1 hypothetical protein C7460_12943 [Marinoscillum furvescens DSM 4134]